MSNTAIYFASFFVLTNCGILYFRTYVRSRLDIEEFYSAHPILAGLNAAAALCFFMLIFLGFFMFSWWVPLVIYFFAGVVHGILINLLPTYIFWIIKPALEVVGILGAVFLVMDYLRV